VVSAGIGIVPVLVFVAALVVLDSYKLVRLRGVLLTVVIGCLGALITYIVNHQLRELLALGDDPFRRFVAPVGEEILKATYVIYLVNTKKVGFTVDAVIYGFAIGAGFAVVENSYYMHALPHATPYTWFVRGFGTAVMHGGTTAIVAIFAKSFSDRTRPAQTGTIFLGLLLAIITHSGYNHFFFHPLLSAVGISIALPVLFVFIFERSREATRTWLGIGFDTDVELLKLITSGNVASTKIGQYLETLRNRFRGEIIADMLCYLRIHLELAVQAKGLLLMREAGFEIPRDPEVEAKFKELNHLHKTIGTTGYLTLKPILHRSDRELWQLHMLGQQ